MMILALLLQAAPIVVPTAPSPESSSLRVAAVPPGAGAPVVPRHDAARPPRRAPRLQAIAHATRAATIEPGTQGFVNAIQIYPFGDGLVYQLYTRSGRVTDVALQAGERLIAVASGDTVRWVIGDTTSGSGADQRTHILIKPSANGLATNLVVTTDRRTYHLAATSSDGPAMPGVSWSYPNDTLLAVSRAVALAPATPAGLALDRLSFDYAISGDRPPWRPVRAFDDGRQTFIEFPPSLGVGEAPPLFLVDRKGEAQLVNYRQQGRFYVVDRLFEAAELRLGAKRQSIVRIARRNSSASRSGL